MASNSADLERPMESVSSVVIYNIIRKMDRLDNIISQLAAKGIILPEELTHADLSSTLAHAERIVKLRQKAGLDSSDIEEASEVIRKELKVLQERLGLDGS